MATKKTAKVATTKTSKPAPKATKTVTTSTGKAKTLPAKKPASKPVPRAVATPVRKSTHTTGSKIACVIGAIATIALVVIAIVAVAHNVSNKINPAMIAETGDGEKIVTSYVNFNDDSFRVKIPNTFTRIDENKADSSNGKVVAAFNSADEDMSIAITNGSTATTNGQIKTAVEAAATALSTANSSVKGTDFYQVGAHNVGTLDVEIGSNEKGVYEQIAYFSQNDKLFAIVITYGSDVKSKEKWQPVGNFVIKSLDFLK